MIITTTNSIPKIQWRDVEILGIVSGSAIQPKYTYKKSTGAGTRNYINNVSEARKLAAERMVDEADELGASAVTNAEYIITPLANGEIEVTIYGTAIKYNKLQISKSSEDSHFSYEIPEFLNELIINSAHGKGLQKSEIRSLLKKINEKLNDLSYEICRNNSTKEHINYVFDEIAGIIVLFGQLAFLETSAFPDLQTVVGEEIKKENTILTHEERKKYYEDL